MDVRGGTWLVIGLARSGCAAGALLRRQGARVIGADDAGEAALTTQWQRHGLADEAREAFDEVRAGPGWEAALPRLQGVVLSPGVPSPRAAIAAPGVPVLGELELAARFFAGRTVAITGTNGKTTTTELAAHLLRAAGYTAPALGNVGRPLSRFADSLGSDAVAVVEVSSFQLESVAQFRPEVAVVLNLAPDHLDRYASVAEYYAVKRRLVDLLPPGGLFVTGTGCQPALAWPAPRRLLFGDPDAGAACFARDGRLWRLRDGGPRAVLALEDFPLHGAPNVLNAGAALAALEPFDLSDDVLADGLRSFRGLPHRQQEVARGEGLVFVDDSKATNVHAVCGGLAGYAGDVVLILGGSGKGEDYAPLRRALGPVRAAVLIGAEADRIAAALDGAVPLVRAADLDEAVAKAAGLAAGTGTVLLSPACASFDMFRDYHHRGEAFRDAARGWLAGRAGAAPRREEP